jgi:small subunit ribosomal protein S3
MGQKVHPTSFRMGCMRDWNSRWYASKADFGNMLLEDAKIRKLIEKEMATLFLTSILKGQARE